MGRTELFKGRQFTAEVILWAVRWTAASQSTTPLSSGGSRLMRSNWRSGSGRICG
jgi:hypothetical protein